VSSRARVGRWGAVSVVAALAIVLAGAGAREVELKAGETLTAIARRELGDVKAAAELRALNGLSQEPGPGARIRLPGDERDRAVRAIAAARNALQQIDGRELREQARTRITEAERHLAGARYVDAATSADAAWKLLSTRAPEHTRFTVAVGDRGQTKVVSRSGQPARVEAQGVQRAVEPGQAVSVEKGEPPSEPAVAPLAPALASPTPGAVLKLKPDPQGRLGPVRLSWSRSENARAYEVRLLSSPAGTVPLVFTSAHNAIELPPLPAGTYTWTVKAQGDLLLESALTEPWTFELRPQKLKLEVQETKWK
jgi:hypothetical protein